MVLNIPGIKNPIFQQSKIDDVGVGQKKLKETRFQCIPSCSFIPTEPNGKTWEYTLGRLHNSGEFTLYVISPVYLPNEALVISVSASCPPGGLGHLNWSLKRMNRETWNVETMATEEGEIEDKTINHATINNKDYFYFLESSLGGDEYFLGARIEYIL